MPDQVQSLVSLTPVLQYGFAGFSLLLLGLIFWLISRLLELLKASNQVIGSNTAALLAVRTGENRTRRLVSAIRRDLAARPCALAGQDWPLKHPIRAREPAASALPLTGVGSVET